MSVLFYLWEIGADSLPQRVATVEVNGRTLRAVESTEPEMPEVLAEIAGYPSLPLRYEAVEQTPTGPVMSTNERQVTPDDPQYPYAVGQIAASACGLLLTFKPDYFLSLALLRQPSTPGDLVDDDCRRR